MSRSKHSLKTALAALVTSTALFVGATAAQSLVTPDRIGNPDAENTITWAGRQTLSHHIANPGLAAHFEQAFQDWAERHPDFKIELSIMAGGGNEAMARLLEQTTAGRQPDFALIDSFFLATFAPYLQPINHYLSDEEFNDFVPFAREGVTFGDDIKALWLTTDVRALYYNTEIVDSPPATWDELMETGKALADDGYVAYVFPGGRGEGAVMENLPMFWSQGGRLVDEAGRPVFNEGENRAAMLNVLNFLKDLVDEGVSPARVTTFGNGSDLNPDIASGQVAMFLGGSWILGQLPDLLGEEEAAKWHYAPIPNMSSDLPLSTAVGGWAVGVFTEDAAKQAAIVDFIQTAYSGYEGMAGLAINGSLLPTRVSVAGYDHEYFKSDATSGFAEMTEYGRPRPGATIYPTISTELQVAISDTISGRKTAEDALDDAWQRVIEEYEAQQQ